MKKRYSMRLRNIPGAREEMLVNPYVIQEPAALRGHFSERFQNHSPLCLEIGMGKGKFLSELAALHPEINYIGIEKYSSVLIRAIEKQEKNPLPNLLFLRLNAEMLPEIFAEGEIDKIYLNFSDPWPKERHAKRRLTSTDFLARYQAVLKDKGVVEFKTDNFALFDFSLEQAEEAGWKILSCTRDLHHDPVLSEGNIMTEYEERFSSMGNPICRLVLEKP